MSDDLGSYRYTWPQVALRESSRWQAEEWGYVRQMPESADELAADSRWPGFFPSPICFVTTSDGQRCGLEKVVGASIVNRFPYLMALSFCVQRLSERHHARQSFTDMLETGASVAVQFLPRRGPLDRAMDAIAAVPETQTHLRIAHSGLSTRKAISNDAPVFDDAYLVYEARLVKPGKDFQGRPILATPSIDVGSHRVYFLEINTIQLREDIADGRSQIRWRSLPAWEPGIPLQAPLAQNPGALEVRGYQKGYTPHYSFPSSGTVAFATNEALDGMKVMHLPPLAMDQVEVDNDRARWPCFFPSSLGMITTWGDEDQPNLMPCGSTTVLSRHPLVIATSVCYAGINERYAPRATLSIIRSTGRFGCGVPFINDAVIDAIRYAGNTSLARDPGKVAHAGLSIEPCDWAPRLCALPVHFDCQVTREIALGTHSMFLGEVRRIKVRRDVTPDNPIEWCPWADVTPASVEHSLFGRG